MKSSPSVADLLSGARSGDQSAVAALMPLVYDELRRLAASYLRRERPGQTLQATALVNEAYMRLVKAPNLAWQDRAHFIGIAAHSMRQILVDRARARGSRKRGGERHQVTLDEAAAAETGAVIDVLAVDEALERLAALDPQQARIVEMRFFGGLTVEETAEALGISPATVKRDWSVARAWLHRELSSQT
jgi:RNA polymerase sigma factor (TIGR02999 family)